MATNVFGNPITDETLKGMPEYMDKPEITSEDRAHVALNMKNAGGKDTNALNYVKTLKREWGDGVSTLCVIYNATGNPLTFVTSHDYYGNLGQGPYPTIIENGQWGGFLHVTTSGAPNGSTAAVVYRGKNAANYGCDWMLAWDNPWNRVMYDNKAYTEIRDAHHYDENKNRWGVVNDKMYRSGLTYTDEWNGCLSYVSTGSNRSVTFEGIMTLKNA